MNRIKSKLITITHVLLGLFCLLAEMKHSKSYFIFIFLYEKSQESSEKTSESSLPGVSHNEGLHGILFLDHVISLWYLGYIHTLELILKIYSLFFRVGCFWLKLQIELDMEAQYGIYLYANIIPLQTFPHVLRMKTK